MRRKPSRTSASSRARKPHATAQTGTDAAKLVIRHFPFPTDGYAARVAVWKYENKLRQLCSAQGIEWLNPPDPVYGTARLMSQLARQAVRGDREALAQFVELLRLGTDALEQLAREKPELVRPLAETMPAWPVSFSLHRKRRKDCEALLKMLGVGTRSEIAASNKSGWNPERTANKYALVMFNTVTANQSLQLQILDPLAKIRRKCPTLPVQVEPIPQWAQNCATLERPVTKKDKRLFELGWQALMEATRGRPETDPELRALGKHRERHSQHTGQQIKGPTPKTAVANIRDGIKDRLRRALLK